MTGELAKQTRRWDAPLRRAPRRCGIGWCATAAAAGANQSGWPCDTTHGVGRFCLLRATEVGRAAPGGAEDPAAGSRCAVSCRRRRLVRHRGRWGRSRRLAMAHARGAARLHQASPSRWVLLGLRLLGLAWLGGTDLVWSGLGALRHRETLAQGDPFAPDPRAAWAPRHREARPLKTPGYSRGCPALVTRMFHRVRWPQAPCLEGR